MHSESLQRFVNDWIQVWISAIFDVPTVEGYIIEETLHDTGVYSHNYVLCMYTYTILGSQFFCFIHR